MFDETTEELCRELGLDVWFPGGRPALPLRQQGRDGAPRQPRRRAERAQRAGPREKLRRAAPPGAAPGLGKHLVVQTPFGDSGHTTFFISNRGDWRRHAAEITARPRSR